jgi:hypothetical protein
LSQFLRPFVLLRIPWIVLVFDQPGHGGFLRRSAHNIGRLLITRSDSGQRQLNYSELAGAAAAAAISANSYHPESAQGLEWR